MKTLPAVTCFLALFATFSPIYAQTGLWQPTGGPPGSQVTGLEEADRGVLLASTTSGTYRSTDRGDTWQRTLDLSTTAVLWHSGRRVFAATEGHGVHSSTDNGISWAHLGSSPDTIFCLRLEPDGKVFGGGLGFVWIGTHLGSTARVVSFCSSEVYAFAFKPEGDVWAATNGEGVHHSADSGKTWTSGSTGLEDQFVQDIAVAPSGDLFAATRSGVFRSTDDGQHWNRCSPNWGATAHKIAISHGGRLFVAAHNGVYVSNDDGWHWAEQAEGLTTTITGALLLTRTGEAYVGTWGEGVFEFAVPVEDLPHEWLSGDRPGDGFGNAMAPAGDVNGDGWPDMVVGSPYADLNGASSGSARVYFGGPGLYERESLLLGGSAAPLSYYGSSVAGPGDLNGDGFDDIGVVWSVERNHGKACIFLGDPQMDAEPDFLIDDFIMAVWSAGDLNGDGRPDLVVSNQNGWRIQVYFGNAGSILVRGPEFFGKPWSYGYPALGRQGCGVGDLNRDGYDDFAAATAILETPVGFGYTVIYGAAQMIGGSVGVNINAGGPGMWFPTSLAGGDFNGDGVPDIAAGNPDPWDSKYQPPSPDLGQVRVSLTGLKWPYGSLVLRSPKPFNGYGGSVSSIGDPNGDGFTDIIVGTPSDSAWAIRSGGALLYRGGNPLDTTAYTAVAGGAAFDRAGRVAPRPGDYDGDGRVELLMSAAGNPAVSPGRVYFAELGTVPPVEPTAVVPAEPPHGATGVACDSALHWFKSKHTLWYDLQVSTDPLMGNLLWDTTGCRDTSLSTKILQPSTTYYWRVRGRNKAVTGAWSICSRFTTGTRLPGSVTLLYPRADEIVASDSLQFRWSRDDSQTSGYVLNVAADSMFLTVRCDTSITDTALTLGGFTRGHRYWWRVRGHNSYGWGPFGEIREFLMLAPPGPVTLLAPADSAVLGPWPVTFLWDTCTAGGYQLTVAADPLFTTLIIDSIRHDPGLVTSGFTTDGLYWWRVRATNAAGWGEYSTTWTFRVIVCATPSEKDGIPQTFSLSQNYPNPFNPSTTIRYGLPQRSHVIISVYNTLGQQVVRLLDNDVEAGYHDVTFDASGIPSGVYIYRLHARSPADGQAMSYTAAKKLLLVR